VTAVRLRPATREDVALLVALLGNPEVEPYLAASRAHGSEEVEAEVDRGEREPDGFGVLVIELDREPAGTVTWESVNRRSRIAAVSGLALSPSVRGQGHGPAVVEALVALLVRERGFHRLQMEVYAFNERALRHAERAGWIREGVRRKAYWRDGTWVDGVLFGIVEEDLGPGKQGPAPTITG